MMSGLERDRVDGVVLVDGVMAVGVGVVLIEMVGRLDERRAVLDVSGLDEAGIDWFIGAKVIQVALLERRVDGSVKQAVMVRGRAASQAWREAVEKQTYQVTLLDDWVRRLDEQVGLLFGVDAVDSVVARAVLSAAVEGDGVGRSGNRSAGRVTVNGQAVYLPVVGELVGANAGVVWRVRDVLELIAGLSGIVIDWSGVDGEVLDRVWVDGLRLDRSLREVLLAVLEKVGIGVCWELDVDGALGLVGYAVDDGVKGLAGGARQVAAVSGCDGVVVAFGMETEEVAAVRVVMESARPRVEATVGLQAGWDPALGGASISAANYDQVLSSDFEMYRDVFRTWVLNEDGAYSGGVIQATGFDARLLWDSDVQQVEGDEAVVGSVLPRQRLGRRLVMDAGGRRLPAMVEMSLDGGLSWDLYPGRFSLMSDRVGVYWEDATLPDGVVAAGQSGDLRVRVTGTLVRAEPVVMSRWRGNPFVGTALERRVRMDDGFVFQAVHESSVHAAAVRDGSMVADEVDDRLRLTQALLGAVVEEQGKVEGTVRLAGVGVDAGERWLKVGARRVLMNVEEGVVRVEV